MAAPGIEQSMEQMGLEDMADFMATRYADMFGELDPEDNALLHDAAEEGFDAISSAAKMIFGKRLLDVVMGAMDEAVGTLMYAYEHYSSMEQTSNADAFASIREAAGAYSAATMLARMGKAHDAPRQEEIDALLERAVFAMKRIRFRLDPMNTLLYNVIEGERA